MNTLSKITFLSICLSSIVLLSYADRGVSKKGKTKVTLNINTNKNFTSALSFNLRTGLKYKGSLLTSSSNKTNSIVQNSVITYQKGNTVYVIPYKQKIIVPEIRQGYTGMKLIIKSN